MPPRKGRGVGYCGKRLGEEGRGREIVGDEVRGGHEVRGSEGVKPTARWR